MGSTKALERTDDQRQDLLSLDFNTENRSEARFDSHAPDAHPFGLPVHLARLSRLQGPASLSRVCPSMSLASRRLHSRGVRSSILLGRTLNGSPPVSVSEKVIGLRGWRTALCLSFFAGLRLASLLQCPSQDWRPLMKAFRSLTSIVGIVVCICGCATSGTDRVVQVGPNTYKMSGLGESADSSGSAVKARLYQQAAEFCRSKGGQMIPLNSSAQDPKPGQSASAEIRFTCMPASR